MIELGKKGTGIPVVGLQELIKGKSLEDRKAIAALAIGLSPKIVIVSKSRTEIGEYWDSNIRPTVLRKLNLLSKDIVLPPLGITEAAKHIYINRSTGFYWDDSISIANYVINQYDDLTPTTREVMVQLFCKIINDVFGNDLTMEELANPSVELVSRFNRVSYDHNMDAGVLMGRSKLNEFWTSLVQLMRWKMDSSIYINPELIHDFLKSSVETILYPIGDDHYINTKITILQKNMGRVEWT